jgi:uncharacterized protein YbgA (DUF1722 family)/uncharacterized protein YbbK (DUF523 family)
MEMIVGIFMKGFSRPRVVVSKCLEFEHCRWNGDMISSDIVKRMMKEVDFIPVCAEVEIGLGVPRDPVRVVLEKGEKRLIQPSKNRDLTFEAKKFAEGFLESLDEADGFLLKSGSPSCGTRDTKIYPQRGRSSPIGRGEGFFSEEVLKRFPSKAIEDENRLRNFKIAEHFLTKLFTLASFRDIRSQGWDSLLDFHTRNKLLFMSYHQGEMREMGRIVANRKAMIKEEAYQEYEKHIARAMARGPRCSSNINVLMHALGHFSNRLSPEEKSYFLDSLMDYREGRIPLSVSMGVIRSWIVRFDDDWLEKQTYFHPFPSVLLDVELTDSCRIRDYWQSES